MVTHIKSCLNGVNAGETRVNTSSNIVRMVNRSLSDILTDLLHYFHT